VARHHWRRHHGRRDRDLFCERGIPVILLVTDQGALDRGIGVVDTTYEAMVKRGRLTAEDSPSAWR